MTSWDDGTLGHQRREAGWMMDGRLEVRTEASGLAFVSLRVR